MDNQPHDIQITILKQLLFHPSARFTNLNIAGLTNDHFTFHIKRLVKLGLVTQEHRRYTLTPTGKEYANRMDTDTLKIERQPKTTLIVICSRRSKSQTHYLIQQRLKQPFYGYYGFVTGKVGWGETITEAASRELMEETNLQGKPLLSGIEHKMDYSPEGQLLEDKYFYVFRVKSPSGTLQENFEGGKNLWLSKTDILKLPDLFADMQALLSTTDSPHLFFTEYKFTVQKY